MFRTSMILFMVAACAASDVDATDTAQRVWSPPGDDCSAWTQLGGSAKHTGKQCGELQGMRVADRFQVDDNPEQLNADLEFLSEHEGSPLVTSDGWVYVPIKAGYVDLFRPSTQRYGVLALQWVTSRFTRKLTPRWKVLDVGKWSPIDVIGETEDPETTNPYAYTNAYMQMYQPIIVGNSIYLPASTGGMVRLDRFNGVVQANIAPFVDSPFDDAIFTHGVNVPTADQAGRIYYAVTAFPLSANISDQPRGSWLVQIQPDNTFSLIDWTTLARPPFAKGLSDRCQYQFGTAGTPLPTGPDSQPPEFGCGTQRPMFNTAVAINDEGVLLMGTGPNNAITNGVVLAVDSTTMKPIWSADLLGHLRYGCGVRFSIGPPNSRCSILTANGTTNIGADPRFNGAIHLTGYMSIMDNQIVVAPDQSLVFGSYDSGTTISGGFNARGALLRFAPGGAFMAKDESFGWEVTPALQVSPIDGSFTFAQDDQHYNEFDLAVARKSPSFTPEIRGKIPLDFNRVATDWLDAQVAVDNTRNIYGLSAMGLYCKFDPSGAPVDCVELLDSNGERYSIETLSQYSVHVGSDIYVIHGGWLYVIESTGGPNKPLPFDLTSQAKLIAGRQAKAIRAGDVVHPEPPTD